MQILTAQPVTQKLEQELRERLRRFQALTARAPGRAVVLVGEDPPSQIYVKRKAERALQLGIQNRTITFPATASPQEVYQQVQALNQDPSIDGILIQRPLPPQFDEAAVLTWIVPEKDVDAFHPENAGRLFLGLPGFEPCTPAGVLKLLDHYGIEIAGKVACVVGRSSIVGKPMAALLLRRNATVIQCHSQTQNLAEMTRQADLLIVATGQPKLIQALHVKPGAVVVDVGIHRGQDGKIGGDCDWDSLTKVASAATPVPGGVGPMTIALLMANTVLAAEKRQGIASH